MDKNAKKQNVLGDEALDKVSGGFGSKISSDENTRSVIVYPDVEGPANPGWEEKVKRYPPLPQKLN